MSAWTLFLACFFSFDLGIVIGALVFSNIRQSDYDD